MFQSADSRYNQRVRNPYRFVLRSAWDMTGAWVLTQDLDHDSWLAVGL